MRTLVFRERHMPLLASGLLVVLVLVVGVLCLVDAARAQAAVTQFGSEGEGAGQLRESTGIALNQASGEVYLADTANIRLEEFSSSGSFLSAWGWAVARGGGLRWDRSGSGEVSLRGPRGASMGIGLQAGSTYHFRVSAENANDAGHPVLGPEWVFTTRGAAAFSLADARLWEMVSPQAMHGALISPDGRVGETADWVWVRWCGQEVGVPPVEKWCM
jgi:hypothetical protein